MTRRTQEHDPFGSSSYSFASSSSDSLRTRSLDVIPLKTSFRIESVECAERLYQTLGIFGLEDLGIQAYAWEVSKSRHSSVVLPASRSWKIDSLTNQEEAHETGVRVDDEAVELVELAPSNELENCYYLPDVRSSGVGGADAIGGGGIKGARLPMLAPLPLPLRLEDAGLEDYTLSSEAIKEAFLNVTSSISSRASSIITIAEDEEDDANSCIQDPGPSNGKLLEEFLGISPAPTIVQSGPFGNEKGGGLPQTFRDDVIVTGVGDSLSDEEGLYSDIRVLGTEISEGEKACVDELQGLKIKQEVDHKDNDQQDNIVR